MHVDHWKLVYTVFIIGYLVVSAWWYLFVTVDIVWDQRSLDHHGLKQEIKALKWQNKARTRFDMHAWNKAKMSVSTYMYIWNTSKMM